MKLKILVIIMGSLIGIQVVGYRYCSPSMLFDDISNEICNEFCRNENIESVLVFYSNSSEDTSIVIKRSGISSLLATDHDKKLLKESLTKRFENVRFIETDSQLQDSLSIPYTVTFFLFNQKELFISNTDQEITIFDDAGESYSFAYQRKFIWILFCWVKIEEKGANQS